MKTTLLIDRKIGHSISQVEASMPLNHDLVAAAGSSDPRFWAVLIAGVLDSAKRALAPRHWALVSLVGKVGQFPVNYVEFCALEHLGKTTNFADIVTRTTVFNADSLRRIAAGDYVVVVFENAKVA